MDAVGGIPLVVVMMMIIIIIIIVIDYYDFIWFLWLCTSEIPFLLMNSSHVLS